MSDNETHPLLGIDLGTTFSSMARWEGRGPQILRVGNNGQETRQSVVYRGPHSRDEVVVGRLAYRYGLLDPDNVVIGVKRYMDDASRKITLGGHDYTPIELSAEILKSIYRQEAERFPENVFQSRGTVVTVPYYFKAHQCENTRRAAEEADVECLAIVQEPIAASLRYAWKELVDTNGDSPAADREESSINLVFDLGGGTFDLTLFRFDLTRDKMLFEVLATDGDARLGGLDFDRLLTEYVLERSGIDLSALESTPQRKAYQTVNEQAIFSKEELSNQPSSFLIAANVVGGQSIMEQISREQFEACIDEQKECVRRAVRRVLDRHGIVGADVRRAILVGGSSKIPCMKQVLSEELGGDRSYEAIDPATCVAEGAAIWAAHLDDPELLGREIEVRTATAHSLGVATRDGDFAVIIPADCQAPCGRERIFRNTRAGATSLGINVYQGSSPRVEENTLIGRLHVSGLTPRPRGRLPVKVRFEVKEDQTLSVIVEADGKRKRATLRYA